MMEVAPGIELRIADAPIPYRAAVEEMDARNREVAEGNAAELIWLLEHPPVYTAGTSATAEDLIDPRFEVVETGRGGKLTYHGPGQRIGYVVVDLARRGRDVRVFVHALENWVIATLGDFGVESWSVPERVGIWTQDVDGREAKIGAIGVRVRKWVTMHGFSVNLFADLGHYSGIVPCGIGDLGVTSMDRLGKALASTEWDRALLGRADAFLSALEKPSPVIARTVAAGFLLALPLAGCSQEQGAKSDAPVEVLPGTVSDAMLAEDRVRSEPDIDRSAAVPAPGATGEPRRAAARGSSAAEESVEAAPEEPEAEAPERPENAEAD